RNPRPPATLARHWREPAQRGPRDAPRGRLLATEVSAPALPDPPNAPHQQRDRPGRDKQPGDDVTERVDVDLRHRVPESALEPKLTGGQRKQLGGPHDE